MAHSRSKKDIIKELAQRMNADEETANRWLDGVTDTLYETFKSGYGASLTGFGSFYLDRRRSSTAFKFNPGQKLKKLLGWSSSYKGEL
jgi:nucleoid DNA-binding protein